MSQIHAPPTEEEYLTHKRWTDEECRNMIAWSEEGGWCSACRASPVLVAHMGRSSRSFALCGACVGRLAAELATPPNGEEP